MLSAHQISKTYNIQAILADVTINLNKEDRIGLVGPNGSGKSTLLRILAKRELPDSGVVIWSPPGLRVGFLSQGLEVTGDSSLLEYLIAETSEAGLEEKIAHLAAMIAEHPHQEEILSAFDTSLKQLARTEQLAKQGRRILDSLGLEDILLERKVETLSGGQKTRLALAKVLLQDPEMLLLDEPTNHLDIAMLEWLEDWLRSFRGGVLIASHDRTLLDHSVTQILDLDPETHRIRLYNGNFRVYLQQYLNEQERQAAQYRNQEAETRRLRQDIARTKQQALRVELATTSRQPGVRRYAKKVARKAKSREKKLTRYLDSDERIEKPGQSWQVKVEFDHPEFLSRTVLVCTDLAIGYPGQPSLLEHLDFTIGAGERIALTGPNGGGKTTLLRTIAGQLPVSAGELHLGASIRLGYMSQEQEDLDPELSALQEIQRIAAMNDTEARSFLHYFLFSGDEALRPAGDLSFGERARLSLAKLVAQGCNFLLLDEPVNHLDIPSRTRFEQSLHHFEGTLLAVVHDRYFIDRFATSVWMLRDRTLHQHPVTDLP